MPSEMSVARLEMRHRIATVASLRPFFKPSAVAVVGASRNPASIGYRILGDLVKGGFSGPLYPVNPKAAEIQGLRAYPSVREVPNGTDLAIIAVPRDSVLGVVDDCANRGLRAIIVITAGFAEVAVEGKELQSKLIEKVRGYGIRLIGPNCVGILSTSPENYLNATFVPMCPPRGTVAMSSDSGALGLAVLATATRLELGISTFVSVGNRADVSSNDLLEYWEEDDSSDVILLYLESFGNPRRFARIARRVSRRKPIVAVKAGRTKAGRRAAGSHTAALAASEVGVDALFHQTGVIRAETMQDLFDLAATMSTQPLPRGRRVAILTNAGGPAILCADACEGSGLSLAEFSESTKAGLARFLPPTASLGNPVDMVASANSADYALAIQILLSTSDVDALIVICVYTGAAEIASVKEAVQQSVATARESGSQNKPVLLCLPEQAGLSLMGAGNARIPCHAFPEAAARVLGKMAAYSEWRSQPLGKIRDFEDIDLAAIRTICRKALDNRGDGWLSTEETRLVLQAMRLPIGRGGVARTPDDAVKLARETGFPVAVKLASCRLVHKTEIGGVHLNLLDEEMVRQAFEAIRSRLVGENNLEAMEGVLVQPMVSGGTELMIGMTQDPVFGPLIAFGLGGIHVEILGDVCFRVTPLTDRDASEMVHGIRGYRLFQGYRGHPAADVASMEEVLLRISQLVEEVPEIYELDLNPIFAMPPGQGCEIVDARISVRVVQET